MTKCYVALPRGLGASLGEGMGGGVWGNVSVLGALSVTAKVFWRVFLSLVARYFWWMSRGVW